MAWLFRERHWIRGNTPDRAYGRNRRLNSPMGFSMVNINLLTLIAVQSGQLQTNGGLEEHCRCGDHDR